jgi:hypothetical protein
MLPLAPIFNLGWKAAALPTAFEFLDAASRGYYESAAEEVGFDLVGNTLDDVGLTPYGGIGIGAIDIAMDVNGLSDLELKYVSEARQNVPLQVNQAETAFMNAHLASHGIFPWNRPRPSIYE